MRGLAFMRLRNALLPISPIDAGRVAFQILAQVASG